MVVHFVHKNSARWKFKAHWECYVLSKSLVHSICLPQCANISNTSIECLFWHKWAQWPSFYLPLYHTLCWQRRLTTRCVGLFSCLFLSHDNFVSIFRNSANYHQIFRVHIFHVFLFLLLFLTFYFSVFIFPLHRTMTPIFLFHLRCFLPCVWVVNSSILKNVVSKMACVEFNE